jgi:hypothetical protein
MNGLYDCWSSQLECPGKPPLGPGPDSGPRPRPKIRAPGLRGIAS